MIVRWQNRVPREMAIVPLFKTFKIRLIIPLTYLISVAKRYNGSLPPLFFGLNPVLLPT